MLSVKSNRYFTRGGIQGEVSRSLKKIMENITQKGINFIESVLQDGKDGGISYRITGFVNNSEVKGKRQEHDLFGHEIVNSSQHSDDYFTGTIYYPATDDKYLAVEFST